MKLQPGSEQGAVSRFFSGRYFSKWPPPPVPLDDRWAIAWVRVSRVLACVSILVVCMLFLECLLPARYFETVVVTGKGVEEGSKGGVRYWVKVRDEAGRNESLSDFRLYLSARNGQTLELHVSEFTRRRISALVKETGQQFDVATVESTLGLFFFGTLSLLMLAWSMTRRFEGEYSGLALVQTLYGAWPMMVLLGALRVNGVPAPEMYIPVAVWGVWFVFGFSYVPLGLAKKFWKWFDPGVGQLGTWRDVGRSISITGIVLAAIAGLLKVGIAADIDIRAYALWGALSVGLSAIGFKLARFRSNEQYLDRKIKFLVVMPFWGSVAMAVPYTGEQSGLSAFSGILLTFVVYYVTWAVLVDAKKDPGFLTSSTQANPNVSPR
jgi:hypothetical protein